MFFSCDPRVLENKEIYFPYYPLLKNPHLFEKVNDFHFFLKT